MKTILTTLLLMLSIVARSQSADALYDEGKKLYDEKKYELAFKKLLPAAQKGHKKAQYRVGRCYDKGHGVKEDNQKAYQWYLKGAQQGHAKSQYQLGKCYMKGKGCTKDVAKAKTWLTKAVKNPKGGDKVLENLNEDVADGDEDAIAIKKLLGK
ncbi:MAG: sel1 repeat family protein [Bacteroidaceae bacterium]|nr:sel1 repeat family protein [Bacteroidaceae bacterium]